MPDQERRTPEEFLDFLPTPKKGTLKVYVGAAAGVGKTYRMLAEARQLRAEGHDVVIGFIETHGRAETAALIDGLEVIPLREIRYRGAVSKEMDLDAILARKPEFAIVDELAHTNAPGSRNSKRYLDVEELLGAEINVITAVNIQHVESLGPIVRRLTGIEVQETVPDSFFTRASEIVDVDVSIEELRERLRQGKIYPLEQVNLALQNFFKSSNLSALRELTLLEIARDLGRQRQERNLLGGATAQKPSLGERIMVCIPSDPHGVEELLCKGWREAGRLSTDWYAVHVETPGESLQKIPTRDFNALLDKVNLAADLGADVVWLKAPDVIEGLLDFAHKKAIKKIILRRPRNRLWIGLLHRSVAERLFHEARDFDVEVVSDES
jgi:two-component system sensor histidine kinase KdpD